MLSGTSWVTVSKLSGFNAYYLLIFTKIVLLLYMTQCKPRKAISLWWSSEEVVWMTYDVWHLPLYDYQCSELNSKFNIVYISRRKGKDVMRFLYLSIVVERSAKKKKILYNISLKNMPIITLRIFKYFFIWYIGNFSFSKRV